MLFFKNCNVYTEQIECICIVLNCEVVNRLQKVNNNISEQCCQLCTYISYKLNVQNELLPLVSFLSRVAIAADISINILYTWKNCIR